MRTCPNCGRMTKRTKDWACQWCGYPLLSGGYKALPETYSELKGKNKREDKPIIPEPVFEDEPEAKLDLAPRPEPVLKVKPGLESASKPTVKVKPVSESIAEVETEPELKEVAEPVLEARVEPEIKPPPVPAVETEPGPGDPLSVDFLYSRLEANKSSADAMYKDQNLKITGLVYRTVINENLTVAYVILVGARRRDDRQVTCTFDRKHESKIVKLNEGESVTVQGTYDSYTATVLLRDCELI